MKRFSFLLCAAALFLGMSACHETNYETPLSDSIRLPVVSFGENAGPIRFVTARRAVDNGSAALFSKEAADTALLGKLTFTLPDSAYLAYDRIVMDINFDLDSRLTSEIAAGVVVGLFNGKTASHTEISADGKQLIIHADGDPWQNENTLLLFGLTYIKNAVLTSSTDSTLRYELPPFSEWGRAQDLPSITYEWYLPPEKRRDFSLPLTTRLKNFFAFDIDPVSLSPQWTTLVLNSSRPLPVYPNVPETLEKRLEVQSRIEAQDISSQMALTSLAIWYEIEFFMPDSPDARNVNWNLVFSKIGAGALWVNGHRCADFIDRPGCYVAPVCPNSIIYGGRNRLNFVLIPSRNGVVLDAVELYPGAVPIEQ